MSNGWLWVVLALMVQTVCPMLNPRGYQRGKLLTAPLRKWFPKMFDNSYCRITQIFLIYGVYLLFRHSIGTRESLAGPLYILALISLYIDDYFTNDDNWKKWWSEVRNKIKWKMALPAPTPAKVKS